jgi:hypothetical protein
VLHIHSQHFKAKVDDILSEAKELVEALKSKSNIDKYRSSTNFTNSSSSMVLMNNRFLGLGGGRTPRNGQGSISIMINKGLEHSKSAKDDRRIQQINDMANDDFRSLRKNLEIQKSLRRNEQ